MKSDSEKQKEYRTMAKFFKRHDVAEAKILLFDGTIHTYKSSKRSLK